MDFVNVKINDKTYVYKKGTIIEEVSRQLLYLFYIRKF